MIGTSCWVLPTLISCRLKYFLILPTLVHDCRQKESIDIGYFSCNDIIPLLWKLSLVGGMLCMIFHIKVATLGENFNLKTIWKISSCSSPTWIQVDMCIPPFRYIVPTRTTLPKPHIHLLLMEPKTQHNIKEIFNHIQFPNEPVLPPRKISVPNLTFPQLHTANSHLLLITIQTHPREQIS